MILADIPFGNPDIVPTVVATCVVPVYPVIRTSVLPAIAVPTLEAGKVTFSFDNCTMVAAIPLNPIFAQLQVKVFVIVMPSRVIGISNLPESAVNLVFPVVEKVILEPLFETVIPLAELIVPMEKSVLFVVP